MIETIFSLDDEETTPESPGEGGDEEGGEGMPSGAPVGRLDDEKEGGDNGDGDEA